VVDEALKCLIGMGQLLLRLLLLWLLLPLLPPLLLPLLLLLLPPPPQLLLLKSNVLVSADWWTAQQGIGNALGTLGLRAKVKGVAAAAASVAARLLGVCWLHSGDDGRLAAASPPSCCRAPKILQWWPRGRHDAAT
jgi:hypothetical protein